jgi:hypothetical protein
MRSGSSAGKKRRMSKEASPVSADSTRSELTVDFVIFAFVFAPAPNANRRLSAATVFAIKKRVSAATSSLTRRSHKFNLHGKGLL